MGAKDRALTLDTSSQRGIVALKEGHVKERVVRVDKLEKEGLGDQGIHVLGICAMILVLIQRIRNLPVHSVENLNLDRIGNATDDASINGIPGGQDFAEKEDADH